MIPLDDSLGLDAFGSEAAPVTANTGSKPAPPARPRVFGRRTVAGKTWLMAASAVLIIVAAGIGAYALRGRPFPWAPRTGTVTFETVPAGVDVLVAQKSIGRSPVTVALPPGTYDVHLGTGPQARPLNVVVTAGTSVVQHYEMAARPVVAAPTPAGLRIQTDPANLTVMFDGVEKGVAPVTIAAVAPGDHEVAVRRDQTVIQRTVHVAAGEETSVIISAAPLKPDAGMLSAGWLSARAAIPLKVAEGGRVIGSSDVDRFMLPSGDHDLEFVNDGLGFRVTRRVNIGAGKTTVSSIAVPNGSLSLNAEPWADVYVDGNHLGQTPLGNLSLPIGTHEVVFRHPDLGERREAVTVTMTAPARLGVDLRKQ